VLIEAGTVAAFVGLGIYLNRYVSAWRFRDDPGIMRFVRPMSRVGLLLLALGLILFSVGVLAAFI